MSKRVVNTPSQPGGTAAHRGQSLVELALVLPLLLVLLLGAIDFGRVFFGWVAVTNATRVGANYAAIHPDAWATGNTTQQEEYRQLIRDAGADNCGLYETTDPPPPVFPDGSRDFGDRVRVDLTCTFNLVNPVLGPVTGPVDIGASSTFNVRNGCVNCAPLPPGPPPPPQNHCRPVPNIVGQSVAGARLKWSAAGFTGALNPETADDWRTVSSQTVDQGGEAGCDLPYAFFTSSATVTLAAIVEPAPGETCRTVPNVLGMTVADARTTWSSAGFDSTKFTPATGADDQIVSAVTYIPADASYGQCREPDEVEIAVSYVSPPPAPPAAPCQVPSFVNTARSAAQNTWTAAGFTGAIQYTAGPNWTVIGSQSIVGGSYVVCSSSIRLSP